MKIHIHIKWWDAYKNYVNSVMQPAAAGNFKDISYWRDSLFCNTLANVAPLSIIALVPCIFIAIRIGLPVIAITDLMAFFVVIVIMTIRGISLGSRKLIFFSVLYYLSIVLLYYRTSSSAGMLFLLTITILIAITYSSRAAYFSVLANVIICGGLAIIIYTGVNAPFIKDNSIGPWIALSSNLLLVGLVCVEGISFLLRGLETTMNEKLAAEKESKKTYERLLFHIENAPLGFMEWDSDFKIRSWSKRAEEIFGWTEAEFAEMLKDGYSQVYAEDLPWVSKLSAQLAEGAVDKNTVQCRHYTKDGRVIWCEWFNSTLKNEDGKTSTMLSLVNDITEQKLRQEKLNKANRLFAFITEVSQNVLRVQDDVTLFHNIGNIAREFGKFKIAWIGLFDIERNTISQVYQKGITPYDMPKFTNVPVQPGGPQEKVLKNGEYYICNDIEHAPELATWQPMAVAQGINSCMILPIRKSGNVIGTFNLYAIELNFFEKEEITLLLQAAADISYTLDFLENARIKKELEEEVIEAEKQKEFDRVNLNALINNTSDLMWSVDRNFNLLTSNQPFQEMMQLKTGSVIEKEKNILTATPFDEQSKRFKKSYERAFAGEHFTEIERMTLPVESWSEISYYPIRKMNEVVGTACHWHDITESKKAEIEIKGLANRLVLATKSAGMGIWDWDIKKEILSWDKGMYLLYNIDEVKFGSAYDGWISRLHPEDLERVNKDIQNAINGEKEYNTEFRIIWDDLSVHFIRATGIIERDEAGDALRMIGVNWDITDSKKAENEIRELNKSLQQANVQQSSILNTLPAKIALLDKAGVIIAVNEGWKHFADGNNFQGFNHSVGDNYITVSEILTGDDTQNGKDIAGGIRSILKGEIRQFAMEYPCHSPTEERWFRAEVRPLSEKENLGAVIMHVNITEQKLSEKVVKELNENLEIKIQERTSEIDAANKELEAFNYTVSHDLQAPLRIVNGFVKIIVEDYGDKIDDTGKQHLSFISNSVQKMSQLIKDLLAFAKLGKKPVAKVETNMNEIVNVIISEAKMNNKNFSTEVKLHSLTPASCDPALIKQVWSNLILNAIKYSKKKEKPVVEIGNEIINGAITYYVKDNGAGFDMKHADKLFGVFKRLHAESDFEGTGVGLATVQRIVVRHGGEIWAQAKVNEGATFYFTLAQESKN